MMLVWLLLALQIKHFIWDFYYQPPYMWQNKGTFGHPGGILHSGLHAITTFYLLFTFPVTAELAALIAAGEFIVHYLTDYAKMNINRIKGWACNTHNEFWQLTGLDQLFHQLTYVAILAIIAAQ